MTGIDWRAVFVPDTPVLEIFVRGSVMYLALFALLRFVLRREAGSVGVTDLLVIVLIADAAQNGMAADYTSIADGVLLVGTIVFWAYALNWLGFHFPAVQRLIHPPPLPLVRDGQLLRRNMRQELITEDELLSQLRLQGCENLADVEFAAIEGDGRISVVMRDGKRDANHARERTT
jgi:uncharacterized membrane protein YcaP (DUF421 family)